MTRNEFIKIMDQQLESIKNLFAEKNKSYGVEDDAFHNFAHTALRVHGDFTYHNMFKVLMTYMDKHLVALTNKGLEDKEFEERLRDIIVYSLIAIAMSKDFKQHSMLTL